MESEPSYFYFSPKNEFDNDIVLTVSVEDGDGGIVVIIKMEGSGLASLPSEFDYDDRGIAKGKSKYKIQIP